MHAAIFAVVGPGGWVVAMVLCRSVVAGTVVLVKLVQVRAIAVGRRRGLAALAGVVGGRVLVAAADVVTAQRLVDVLAVGQGVSGPCLRRKRGLNHAPCTPHPVPSRT